MIYVGYLDLEKDWDFSVEVKKLIHSTNMILFEMHVIWPEMGCPSIFNGKATLKDNGCYESEWIDLIGYREGLYKSKIVFNSLVPDKDYPDLLKINGIWQDDNDEPAHFEAYLEKNK